MKRVEILDKSLRMLIVEFIEDCIIRKLIDLKDNIYWVEHYAIEQMFWDWFIGIQKSDSDYYLGEDYPIDFETLDELINFIYEGKNWVFDNKE